MDTALTEQIEKLVVTLLGAESQAKRLLQTAREHHISFGFTYNYIDEDIKQVIGHMQLMAEQHNAPTDPPPQP
jgi:hypothetical protein